MTIAFLLIDIIYYTTLLSICKEVYEKRFFFLFLIYPLIFLSKYDILLLIMKGVMLFGQKTGISNYGY